MRLSKIITALISVLCISAIFAWSIPFASATTSDEIRNKIEQAKKQREAAQKKANAIAGQQKEVKHQMKVLDDDISEVQGTIGLISKNINVRKDVDLTKYAVGDEVVFRATEAMAVSVEKP